MSDTALSIHLTDQSIRVVDAAMKGSMISLNEMAIQSDLPSYMTVITDKASADVAKVIEKIVSTMKTKKRSVNVVLPDSLSYSQIVEMPKLKEKELLSAIKYQADQFIPMPIDKTTLDIEILNENPANHTLLVLIVAAPEELVKKIEKLIELSGLVPDSIENELSATGRVLSQFYQPTAKTGATVFLNMGAVSSSLYLFDHSLRLITDSHTFSLGVDLFLKEIQANMNVDPKKALELVKNYGLGTPIAASLDAILEPVTVDLSREIEKFVVSSREKHNQLQTQTIYFFNDVDQIPGLVKKFAAHSTVPVGLFNLDKNVEKTPLAVSYSSHLSSFTCAIGGALR